MTSISNGQTSTPTASSTVKRLESRKLVVVDCGSDGIKASGWKVLKRGTKNRPGELSLENLFHFESPAAIARGTTLHNRTITLDATERATAAFLRINELANRFDIKERYAFATEAVRRAPNIREFIAELEKAYRWKIPVIKEAEEALLLLQGVYYLDPEALGVCIAIGGGSLEIVQAGTQNPYPVALPLGSLVLAGLRQDELIARIDGTLSSVKPALADRRDDNGDRLPLIVTSGLFRTIGRYAAFLMGEVQLQNAFPYNDDFKPKKMLEALGIIINQPQHFDTLLKKAREQAKPGEETDRLDKIEKRKDMIPIGALVLQRIIEIVRPPNLKFCKANMRDGVLYMLQDGSISTSFISSYPLAAAEAGSPQSPAAADPALYLRQALQTGPAAIPA